MALPDTIPTVTVSGRYLFPDGTPLAGQLIWRAPAMLTFAAADVILGGPITAPLDATGRFEVVLPATDAPGMNPAGWSYTVAEQLTGVPVNRSYNVLLPKANPTVDIADVAPADPTQPNYIPVPGPEGPTGPAGSRVHTGTTAPAAALGTDGDHYIRYETSTVLGVSSTTITTWTKAAGAWAQQSPDVRGAAWYVNTASTPSAGTKPGDMLLRTDTGDLWQRGASGWGTSVGNIRGPQGIQGTQGTQGPKGDPGSVDTVNGKAGPAVTLAAADVAAIATTGITAAVAATLRGNGTNHPLTIYGDGVADTRLAVLKSGSIYSNATANTLYSVGVGDTGTDFAGGTYILAIKNGTPPTSNPANGIVAYADGGVLKVRQTDGTIITVGAGGAGAVASVNGKTGVVSLTATDVGALDQAAADARYPLTTAATLLAGTQTITGTKTFSAVPSSSAAPTTANHLTRKSYVDPLAYAGSWGPADHGLAAWAFDPALAQSTALYPGSGPIRITAVMLRVPTTITRIVWFASGYAGGLTTGSWAALYDSAGTRVAATGDMSTASYEPAEVHTAGGATISSPLTAPYAAPAGLYYVASRWQYNTGTGDGPMLLAAESGAGAPPNTFGYTPVRRFGVYTAGAASAPATITVASMENGANRFWGAIQ